MNGIIIKSSDVMARITIQKIPMQQDDTKKKIIKLVIEATNNAILIELFYKIIIVIIPDLAQIEPVLG